MTLGEVRLRVAQIEAVSDDSEIAHTEEDTLHRDVLRYLAEVAPAELAELARVALTTGEIPFSRWYA